jgi:anti-sigma regulatory factor (Ser/Thr protein kinase)
MMTVEEDHGGRPRKISRYNLEPTPASLTSVREFIKTTLKPFKTIEPHVPDIVWATHEAAKNAVEHNPESDAPVEVVCKVLRHSVVVEVRDKGSGFESPVLPPSPPDPEALAGRGMFMMCSLMDEVEAQSGKGGTRIIMLKRFA